jgi:uncharacterized protein (PEP-CTERM system associated)
MVKRPLVLAISGALALPLGAASARAAEVEPMLHVRETWTDNLVLSPQPVSDRVTEVNPGVRVSSEGPSHRASAEVQWFAYSFARNKDVSVDRRTHRASANLDAVLIRDTLTLTALVAQAPQSVSPFGPSLLRQEYSQANRADVRQMAIAPTLYHQLGNFADAQVMLRHDRSESDQAGFSDRSSSSASASLSSGNRLARMGWRVSLQHSDIDFSNRTDTSTDHAQAELRYRLGSTLTPLVRAGYERYQFDAGIGSQGRSWSAGFDWTPSSRSQLQASAGRRFFGSSYHFDASHRTRAAQFRLTYLEDVGFSSSPTMLAAGRDTASMFDSLLKGRIPDARERADAVQAILRASGLPARLTENTEYLSNRYYLQRNLNFSMAYQFNRLTALVNAFRNRSEALESSERDVALVGSLAGAYDNTSQRGASAAVRWALGRRTDLKLSLEARDVTSRSRPAEDQQRAVRISASRQLSKHLGLSMEMRHVRGTQFMQQGGRYRENAVALSLSMRL